MKTDKEVIIDQLKDEVELQTKWLSLIAHDFKGLFSNIKKLLDALNNKSISQEVFMSMLPELKQIAEKNSKTVESTFTWINAQTDGFTIDLEPVSIHNLFLELLHDFDKEIDIKELLFKFVGDTTLSVNTDRFLLKFILKQLLENAIKYSNTRGVIELITNSDLDKVIITVKDNGVGMKSSRLSTIGTLDGATYTGTMGEKGAGLSLVVVKDFVEMLNGKINVSSIENIGTSVEIELKVEK